MSTFPPALTTAATCVHQ